MPRPLLLNCDLWSLFILGLPQCLQSRSLSKANAFAPIEEQQSDLIMHAPLQAPK